MGGDKTQTQMIYSDSRVSVGTNNSSALVWQSNIPGRGYHNMRGVVCYVTGLIGTAYEQANIGGT